MHPTRQSHPRFAAWLVAALLLLAQWGALAHQVEHQAHNPHAPCLVCVSADQFGNAMPAPAPVATLAAPTSGLAAKANASPTLGCVLAFRSRAPPLLSRTI